MTAQPPAGQADDADDVAEAEAAVSNLLGWVRANGVDTSRVAVFVEPSGERGLVAARPVPASGGEPLLAVPLRLAIAHYAASAPAAASPPGSPPSPDSPYCYYPGAPWSVRLASRLLREAGAGPRSPWSAYVRALPPRAPAAASAWGWDAGRRLRDARAEGALHAAAWLADDAFERLLPHAADAWGPELAARAAGDDDPTAFLRERWGWALACVHSRTFLVGTRDGAGARAMLPLLDLCNHAGDEARPLGGNAGGDGRRCQLSFGRAAVMAEAAGGGRARDNVRWDAERRARPGGGGGGEEWVLALTALRPLAAGEELLLSYGERPNDDFLCHYGFVPPLNPHDDVALFSAPTASAAGARAALEQAAEWHWAARGGGAAAAGGGGVEGEAEAAARYGAAVDKALAAEGEQVGGAAREPGVGRAAEGGAAAGQQQQAAYALRVAAGSRVSPGLVALFAELEGGDARRAELLVARRCWQLLRERDCRLLADLAALALDEIGRRRRGRQARGARGEEVEGVEEEEEDEEEEDEEEEDDEEEEEGPFATWFLPHYYRSLVLDKGFCSPDGDWSRTARAEQGAAAPSDDGLGGGDNPPAALARRLLLGGGAAAAGGDDLVPPLGDEERMALTFRAYKGMILVDCLVDSGAVLADLIVD